MSESAAEQFKNECHRVIQEKGLLVKEVALSAKPPIYPAALSRMLSRKIQKKHIQNLYTLERIAAALGCDVVVHLRDRHDADYQI